MNQLSNKNQYQKLRKMMPDIPELETMRDVFSRLESLRRSLPSVPENLLSAQDIIKELAKPNFPN